MTAVLRVRPADRSTADASPSTWPRQSGRWRVGALVVVGVGGYVAAVYAVVVLGGSFLLGHPDASSPLLSITATAVVALTFEAVRGRLGRLATRPLEGAQASPYEVLRGFTAAVGGSIPAEELPSRMARVLAESTDAQWAEVWLALGGRFVLAATWPPERAAVAAEPDNREAAGSRGPAGLRSNRRPDLRSRNPERRVRRDR